MRRKKQNMNSSKRKDLYGDNPIEYVSVKSTSSRSDQMVIDVAGDCLNSDKSPMRVRDGDSLLIHEFQRGELYNNVGKVICFMMEGGNFYVKHLVFFNELDWTITVKMYNPEEREFTIPLKMVKYLFLVDEVLEVT